MRIFNAKNATYEISEFFNKSQNRKFSIPKNERIFQKTKHILKNERNKSAAKILASRINRK